MKRSAIGFSVCLVLILSTLPAHAQSARGIPTYGTDFYGAIITSRDACPSSIPYQGLFALISTEYDTRVSVSYFDKSGKEISAGTYSIPTRSYRQIPLDPTFLLGSVLGDTAEYRAFHIVTSAPATCEFLALGPAATGMSLLFPTSTLGRKYVVCTLPNSTPPGASVPPYCTPQKESSQFTVIAPYDSTRVTITPNGTTRRGKVGTRFGDSSNGTSHPFIVLLRRGQTYTVRADTAAAFNDEAGSIVESDKPIAVIAGHEAALNNITNTAYWGQEQRNLLVQELLPYEYWSSHDYLSIPMVDSNTVASWDHGVGEKVRCVTYDTANTVRLQSYNGYDTTSQLERFHTFDIENVQNGYNVSSSLGLPVLPFAIDYRLTAASTVASAPAMLQLVAWDKATNRYSFAIGNDRNSRSHHYLTLIARADQFATITYYKDGQGPKSVTLLSQIGGNYNIPGHDELLGTTFEVTQGSYSLRADSNFIGYQYGRFSYSTDLGWSSNGPSTYCGEYASTIGMRLRTTATEKPRVSAARYCDSWTISLRSDRSARLAYATALSDPRGVYVRRTADSGYVSTNVKSTDTTLFDTSAVITISVNDPSLPATAYVWVINQAGNDTVLTLHYSGRTLSYSLDSLVFPTRVMLQDTCRTVYIRNRSTADTVSVFQISHKDTHFAVIALKPLPSNLKPGDSLGVSVCFNAKVSRATDTIDLRMDCSHLLLPIAASSFNRSIYATDWDFGRVVVGQSKTHTVNIKNIGKSDVILTKDWKLHDTVNFAFVDFARLPLTLKPGQSVDLSITYTPQMAGIDTTWIDWGTDLVAPYEHSEKDSSQLWGYGVAPGLAWSRPIAAFGTWDRLEDTVTLLNPTDERMGQSVYIDSVVIRGPSASDFSIVDNELQKWPLVNFTMQPLEHAWIKLRFVPQDTISNASPRRDTLYAFDQSRIWPYVLLNGYIGVASVRSITDAKSITFIPRGNAIDCITDEAGWRVACYDALGREVRGAQSVLTSTTFNLGLLPSGLYIIIATDGSSTQAYRFLRTR